MQIDQLLLEGFQSLGMRFDLWGHIEEQSLQQQGQDRFGSFQDHSKFNELKLSPLCWRERREPLRIVNLAHMLLVPSRAPAHVPQVEELECDQASLKEEELL